MVNNRKKRVGRYHSLLTKLYYDLSSPAAFGSPRRLYTLAKEKQKEITFTTVKQWLHSQDVYTLFRRSVTKFPRRKVLVRGPCIQGQIDLVFFQSIAKENKGIKYLLTYIDCFSRWATAIPLKNKKAETVTTAFEKHFLKKYPHKKPLKIQSDLGTEFVCSSFKSMLRRNKISLFHTQQDVKCSIVERFHRTLRELLTHYMKKNKTLKYIDILPQILDLYNKRPHRSLGGRSPDSVTQKNKTEIYDILYGKYLSQQRKKFVFNIGDLVRLSRYKKVFSKSHNKTFTQTIYTVIDRVDTNPPTYLVADKKTLEPLEGSFYQEELCLVHPSFV